MSVLDPYIVLRADGSAMKCLSRLVRGAQAVVAQGATFSKIGLSGLTPTLTVVCLDLTGPRP
jgi:hypothetical protein